jgi:hypothetical protein
MGPLGYFPQQLQGGLAAAGLLQNKVTKLAIWPRVSENNTAASKTSQTPNT